jgi:integrase
LTPMPNPTGKRKPKRRHHGEGTVIKRTDRWRAKPWAAVVPYTDSQGRRREMWLSAASRDEADELRKAELRKLRKGLVRTEQTVGEYVSAWLDTVEVGPGTLPRYQAHIRERIAPTLGDIALTALTPQKVRSAVMRWKGAPQTRGGALRLLRAAMKQAAQDRHIEHDPTAGIPYPKVKRREPVTLTGPQSRHLMAVVKGERFAPILAVSLGLGIRRGEALGLRTKDVDLDAGIVTISKGLRYIPPPLRGEGEGPYRLTGTKTGETREVPLPAFVAEALRQRFEERAAERKATRIDAGNDFVFCDRFGNSVPLETLRTWYLGALKRAGLPAIRWHDLRASTITVLLDQGVDLLTIQRIVGHRDLATTRRYVGKTPLAMRYAADKLGEAMG